MSTSTLMDKVRSFFGIRPSSPRNDFRNPIWGSDDDDDEGDELYTRHQIDVYNDPIEIHREFTRQMQDMFRTFGSMFGDVKSFFDDNFQTHSFTMTDEVVPERGDNFNSNDIREYYLKPGFYNHAHDKHREDIDLDGKISSREISGLFNKKDEHHNITLVSPFSGTIVPGKSSFCQTIITTSVTKPDGTIETRKIVKNGNEVIEETITTIDRAHPGQSPLNSGLNPISSTGIILSELHSLFKNFY